MALENGTIKLPEDRPRWGLKMDKLCTPKGIQAMENALRIFAPYTPDQLFENPALNIEVRNHANEHIEAAIKGFISQIRKNYSDKEVLTKDPVVIVDEINQSMTGKYEENDNFGEKFSEAYVLNEIRGRVVSYLLTMVALKEGAHRHKTSKEKSKVRRGYGADTQHVPTHSILFQLIDNRAYVMGMASGNPGGSKMLNDILKTYEVIKHLCRPFLEEKNIKFQNSSGKTKEELEKENDEIGSAILKRKKREIPLCTIEDSDLLEGQNLVLQFDETGTDLHSFNLIWGKVNLFDEDLGTAIADSRGAQEALRPISDKAGDTSIHIGDLPCFLVDRFKGDLQSGMAGPESLKLIAGESPNYELVRRKLLWYLAQLTCHKADIEDIFDVEFKDKKGRQSPAALGGETGEPNEPGQPASRSDRIYPTERAKDAINETLAAIKQRRTTAVGHTRLLPLIRKANGSITVCKPSRKAKELAANHQITLERGLEILDSQEIIYPEEMPGFLADMGASSIEEIIAMDPANIIVRYETWVEPSQADEKLADSQVAIHARIRETVEN